MERTSKTVVVLGTNGTGKTTLVRSILKASGQKCLVVTPHDMEWGDCSDNPLDSPQDYKFAGIQRHIYDDDTMNKIEHFTRGILVFDDCRAYFNASTDKLLHRLFIARRQRMIDIFAVAHGFSDVPPKFFTFATDIFLFKTLDKIEIRKNVLQRFDELKALQTTVNKRAEKDIHFYKMFKN